jgi:hypothetical protein
MKCNHYRVRREGLRKLALECGTQALYRLDEGIAQVYWQSWWGIYSGAVRDHYRQSSWEIYPGAYHLYGNIAQACRQSSWDHIVVLPVVIKGSISIPSSWVTIVPRIRWITVCFQNKDKPTSCVCYRPLVDIGYLAFISKRIFLATEATTRVCYYNNSTEFILWWESALG